MSKAFTREGDGDSDVERPSPMPEGKNYMTPQGAKKLQDELRRLKHDERPKVVETVSWAAGNGDRSENGDYIYGKKRLREIDKRIEFLLKRLDTAEVIDPAKVNSKQVLFGATVTVRDEDDNEKTYTIVGVDEIDVAKGRISWRSPIANALFKAKEGDTVTFTSPKGSQELEVLRIRYQAVD